MKRVLITLFIGLLIASCGDDDAEAIYEISISNETFIARNGVLREHIEDYNFSRGRFIISDRAISEKRNSAGCFQSFDDLMTLRLDFSLTASGSTNLVPGVYQFSGGANAEDRRFSFITLYADDISYSANGGTVELNGTYPNIL
ncbi:hypothetical protein [Ekhidna sp.]|uniref:hypothetical protein n=1 Tax=Ekhidna sp. TaxID=2608089 RepID=UPI003B5B703E